MLRACMTLKKYINLARRYPKALLRIALQILKRMMLLICNIPVEQQVFQRALCLLIIISPTMANSWAIA